jgi:hypothetical protein
MRPLPTLRSGDHRLGRPAAGRHHTGRDTGVSYTGLNYTGLNYTGLNSEIFQLPSTLVNFTNTLLAASAGSGRSLLMVV